MSRDPTCLEKFHILLVEDSQSDASLFEKSLSKVAANNFEIQRVENLRSALRVLGENEFNIVFLDLSLPDTTGFNGLLSIQNMAPKLPVVILTANEDENLALAAVGQGAQDYLFKDKADGLTIRRAMRYAIQRKNLEELLITRAYFDPLTGLANRALFENRLSVILARKSRSGDGVGILFLDLNRFKQVNDVFGHAMGDQLLKNVAQRLQKSVRAYDTVARFGGDEFALLFDGIKQAGDCAKIAQKIIQKISRPYVISNQTLDIGVSIGIALCLKDESNTCEILLKQADEAMYAAKQSEQSDYEFYVKCLKEAVLPLTYS